MSDLETFVYVPESSPFTIGRSSDADFTISNDELSRKHCRIHIINHRAFIEDLESKNGVFIDDKKIPPNTKVEIFPETKVMLTTELELSLFGGETRTGLKLEAFIAPKPLVRYKKAKVKE